MDFEEKSLAEFAENDLRELLDSNYYAEALRVASDLEFSALLEHDLCSNVVLNDRLITEASLGVLAQSLTGVPISLSAPHKGFNAPIKTEHSYSLCSVTSKASEQDLSDLENECFPAIPINEAEGSRSSLKNPLFSQKTHAILAEAEEEETTLDSLPLEGGSLQRHSSSETLSCCGDCCRPDEDLQLDEESLSSFTMEDLDNEVSDEVLEQDPPQLICTNHTQFPFQSLSNKPKVTVISVTNDKNNTQRIINCTQDKAQSGQENGGENKNPLLSSASETNLPKSPIVNRNNSFISVQRPDNGFGFPPTPPSCSSSDSESGGDQSPPRLCPLYETLSSNFCNPKKSGAVRNANRTPITTSLISTQPRGATGTLNLTEEEKRTLISEGYPVPSRLPLSKAEEKSLKKIRRKIKNKISAQESRRKKKEYMDTLEQRVDNLEQQNKEFKRKVDSLQKKNSDLLSELHNLQSLVNKDERCRSRVTERATLIS